MANGIRTGDTRGFNKGRSSKFREGFRVRQTAEKAGGHIGRNVVEIAIKIKTIVQKPLIIKILPIMIEFPPYKSTNHASTPIFTLKLLLMETPLRND